MDDRLAQRALAPRYSFSQASGLLSVPVNTVRRWSVGNRRRRDGQPVFDDPLIRADGNSHRPLSFANLLELQSLRSYRDAASLQAIRGALDFAAEQLRAERPLLNVEFKVSGRELFLRFFDTERGHALLVNASRGGQLPLDHLVDEVTRNLDYTESIARRWYPAGRRMPVVIDTAVAAGRPITEQTGVRVDAIATRLAEGWTVDEIAEDTAASIEEVEAIRASEGRGAALAAA